ncbi:hypothetical protein cypCar_00050324 [Cyprinus carpio]|nr:hypothetical protein cypCar_00050324 [Cyprinus carpio]
MQQPKTFLFFFQFVIAGILSNLLYKHPNLLQTCFIANIGCLAVSGIGVILLIVDLQPGGNMIQDKTKFLKDAKYKVCESHKNTIRSK